MVITVAKDSDIKPFDCGDAKLNLFLFNKSSYFKSDLLATTYVIEDEINTIAYFSICNDSLLVDETLFESKTQYKSMLRVLIPFQKRNLDSFPALKLGRLAVNLEHATKGIGKMIISYIITLAIDMNTKCACKLITVDAYSTSLGFYEKMGFQYFTNSDKDSDTRQMYLDLKPIINTINQELITV